MKGIYAPFMHDLRCQSSFRWWVESPQTDGPEDICSHEIKRKDNEVTSPTTTLSTLVKLTQSPYPSMSVVRSSAFNAHPSKAQKDAKR